MNFTSAASRALSIVAVIVSSSGCSLIFVQGPPADSSRRTYFDCSTERALPAVDVTLAVIFVASSLGQPETNATALVVNGLVSVAFAIGAYVGFGRVDRCRTATYELRERLMKIPTNPWPPAPIEPTSPQDYPLLPPLPRPPVQPPTEAIPGVVPPAEGARTDRHEGH